MNRQDDLMIPYYQSEYWKSLLTARIKTLKEDSLLYKDSTPLAVTQRGSSSVTNRTSGKSKRCVLPVVNHPKQRENVKDILNDFSFNESGDNSNDKSIFRHTATSFAYLKMKERWNQKAVKKESNDPPFIHLIFPSSTKEAIPAYKHKKQSIDHSNKTKYLLFLKKKNLLKSNLY